MQSQGELDGTRVLKPRPWENWYTMVHHGTPKGKEAQIGNGVVRVYDLFAIFDNLCVSLPKESPKFNGERVRLMIGHELGRNWISQISHDIRMAPASSEKKKKHIATCWLDS